MSKNNKHCNKRNTTYEEVNILARPKKTGLEYFPLDVTAGINDEVELIEAKYGLEGFAIFIKLLQAIYKNGYYINWTEKEQLLFIKRVNVTETLVHDVLTTCLQWKLFDKQLFEDYHILTSHGIQQRFLFAIGRRISTEMEEDYLLLSENEVSASKTIVNVTKTQVNAYNNPQSKVKKSKGKESKEKEEESTQKSSFSHSSFEKVTERFQQTYGLLNPKVVDDIKRLLADGMEDELIIKSAELALLKNKSGPHYPLGMCTNWLNEEIKNLEQLERRLSGGATNNDNGTIERTSAERAQLQYQPKPGESTEELYF